MSKRHRALRTLANSVCKLSSDHDSRHPSFVHTLRASMCRQNALCARSLVNYMLPWPSLDTDVGVTAPFVIREGARTQKHTHAHAAAGAATAPVLLQLLGYCWCCCCRCCCSSTRRKKYERPRCRCMYRLDSVHGPFDISTAVGQITPPWCWFASLSGQTSQGKCSARRNRQFCLVKSLGGP